MERDTVLGPSHFLILTIEKYGMNYDFRKGYYLLRKDLEKYLAIKTARNGPQKSSNKLFYCPSSE